MSDRSAAPDHGVEEFSEHGVQRRLGGWSLRLVTALALAFSTYQLVVAAFHPLSSLVTRSLHVGFLLALTFLIYPAFKQRRQAVAHHRSATGCWPSAPSLSAPTTGSSRPT